MPVAPAAPLTARELNRATLARQGLLEPLHASPADAVRRLGSLQAQHPDWPPIALAARAADAETADLGAALAARAVVRSSLMRNTIHVVAATDLWPMFAVCQPGRLARWRILLKADPRASTLGRRMQAAHATAIAALREAPRSSLELDRLIASEVGPEATEASRPSWREPDERVTLRASWIHFSAFVPLVHVPHDGEGYGRSKYALAADWLGVEPPEIDPAAARAQVARRYLSAFGPASVDDLVAYVGRGPGGIGVWRQAIADLGTDVVAFRGDDGRTLLDLAGAPRPQAETPAPPRLLARWDSALLSHAARHRQRIIAGEHRSAVFTRNADVRPTFLIDGFVAGTWQLDRVAGSVAITLKPFDRPAPAVSEALREEARRVLSLASPGGAGSVRLDA